MKKCVTVFLALAMMLGLMAPAYGVEDPAEDYAAMEAQILELQAQINELWDQMIPLQETMATRYDNYYELYGAMETWDEEMWNLSNDWDEYQWQGYNAGTLDLWEDPEDGDYLAEMKEGMGMHFPEGLNVRVDGVYLETAPMAKDGVSYLPAEALLAALGAADTQVEPVDVDGTPCLPIRLLAEEQGYEVLWDGYYEVITLINWEKLAAKLDEEFTIFNEILRASMNTVDPTKTYESKAKLDYILTLYGEEKHDDAKLSLGMNARLAGDYSAMSMDYTLGTDLSDVEDLLKDFGGQELLDGAKALNGAKYSMLLDGVQGGMYFKGSNLSKANSFLPDNAWVGMEDEAFGFAYTELMAQMKDITLGKLLVLMAKDSYDPYYMMDTMQPGCLLLLGDDVFTTSKSGATTTYTAKMDMVKLAARAARLGLFTMEDLTDLFSGGSIPTVNYTFTAKVSGEKLTAMEMKGKLTWSALTVEMDVSGTETTSEVYMAIKGRYLGKLECKGTSTMKPTTTAIPAIPTEYANYEDLMAQYYESLWGDWYDAETDAATYPLDPENNPPAL